jgi:hypothetical protein
MQVGQLNAGVVTFQSMTAADVEEIMRHGSFLTNKNTGSFKGFSPGRAQPIPVEQPSLADADRPQYLDCTISYIHVLIKYIRVTSYS